MKAILCGYGEIGKAVFKVFSKYHKIQIHDPYQSLEVSKGTKADILLVAIPYSSAFVNIVSKYQKYFKIKTTIVFSTTAIGTCRQLNAVHSPVEGKHPNLAKSIKIHKRWIGGTNINALDFFSKAGFKSKNTEILRKSEWTEFLKLRSTSLYGVNIEFARYSKEVADNLKMPFENIQQFDKDYNKLYQELKMPQYSRYILTPPKGKIGGHCVTSNSKILNKQYPNNLLKEINKNR